MNRLVVTLSLITCCYAQFANTRQAAPSEDTIPAWYQMPKQAAPAYPPYDRNTAYERPPAQHANPYPSYPSYGSRPSYPDVSMGGPSAPPPRRYPSSNGPQDMPYESSLAKYHKLLLRKKLTTANSSRTTTSIPSRGRSSWPKSLRKIYSTITTTIAEKPTSPASTPEPPTTTTARTTPKRIENKAKVTSRIFTKKVDATKTPSTTTTTTKPVQPIEEASTTTTTTTNQAEIRKSTTPPFVPNTPAPPPRPVERTWRPRGFRRLQSTSMRPMTTTKQTSIMEYIWPNTELLAAIKDVVAKFKASLDETGIDQDVRLMGNQLRNTWQQLRTGPMNEQLGRLFEKAADATEQQARRD